MATKVGFVSTIWGVKSSRTRVHSAPIVDGRPAKPQRKTMAKQANSALPTVRTGDDPRVLARLPVVLRVTGLGRSTIYRWIAAGSFPAPVRLGTRAVAWR
jgi:prophage regulatory protein